MSIDDLIRAWQAGDTDEVLAALSESDATRWDFYDSSVNDPIDELERAALATILGTD
jgi:hypothetical protein